MIPIPNRLVALEGRFDFRNAEQITCNAAALPEAKKLQAKLGLNLNVGQAVPNSIHLELTNASSNPESYVLEIHESGVQITSGGLAGLFYACVTLLQRDSSCVRIEDAPRFPWRGSHLDVSRHFMPFEWLKKYVDLLALHKMNVLHLHLTDDQGWRLEIKKYPRLTQIGAWRSKTRVGHELSDAKSYDGIPHGGFYTQTQMQELVAYALERYITIVPEIEMPGHATAALAAYPEFGNTKKAPEVAPNWGVFESVFSPQEQTFAFLEDVLSEVLEIFPSPYIHIGGDECPKKEWKESAVAQKIMKANHLEDEEALQSYFVGRINTFLKSKGRKMIGWDEILEGGLVVGATVMSWRGEAGGIIAAKAGHDVVMTPGTHTYFDHYQTETPDLEPLAIGGCTTLEKVYAYEPIPAELSELEGRHVLGSQAQLWTEYMPTPKDVERMAFPRLCALAEVLWTQPEARDFQNFLNRLKPHLEKLGTNHHPLA
jgi:hexosaminidase